MSLYRTYICTYMQGPEWTQRDGWMDREADDGHGGIHKTVRNTGGNNNKSNLRNQFDLFQCPEI